MVAGHLQEKNGYFYMVLNTTDEMGKRKTKWVSTGYPIKGNKRRAEIMLADAKREFEKAPKSQKKEILFSDYMRKWLEIVKNEIEIDSYAGYSSVIEKRIAPYFDMRKVTLTGLTASDIQDFYTYGLNDLHLSGNTIRHFHANISKALRYAVRKDLISANPMDKVDRPKAQQHVGTFYTIGEVLALIDAVRGDTIEFPTLMAAFYGLRRSEIFGLQWKSVDFISNRMTIEHTVTQAVIDGKFIVIEKDRTKNKSSCRSLPLVPQYRELLLAMREQQELNRKLCGAAYHESDYVYVNDVGEPYKPSYFSAHMNIVLEKNGLRHITPHGLRHTCASLLLQNGISMKEIQEWLGHSNFSTTANTYAHLDVKAKEISAGAMVGIIDIGGALNARESSNKITSEILGENCRRELAKT